MKRSWSSVLVVLTALFAGMAAQAEIVRVRLAERRIEPGERTVIVSVYAAPEGGEPLATETRSARVDARGTIDVRLGQLANAGDGTEVRWLAVRVPPGVESRRVPLAPASTGDVMVHVVPQAAITAPGIVESTVLGFRFPDGTVQTSAATATGGVPSVNGIGGAVTITSGGTASVQTVGSTITVTAPSFGTPVAVGSANAAGVAVTMTRSDHVHAHGNQAGGALHADATTSTAGFLSAADKQTLDDAVTYERTFVVSPVGTAAANGDALIAALAAITGSAASPALLKIEPGNYDLEGDALTMKTFVDVEGSGENVTIITAARGNTSATSTAAAVISAVSSELRSLTVTNVAPGSLIGIGFFGSTTSSLRNVTINSSGATTTSVGVFASGGASLKVRNATITASANGSTSGSNGIQLSSTGKVFVTDSAITAKNTAGSGTGTNNGVILGNASAAATIDGSTILATGVANSNNGVSCSPGKATIMNSTVQVETAGSRIAVSTSASASSIINVYHSRLVATGGASGSQLCASKGLNSFLHIAASQVDSASVGPPKCVHVYDADMDDLNNSCPEPIA